MLTLRSTNLTDEQVDVKIRIQFGYVWIAEDGELIYEGKMETINELLSAINSRSKKVHYSIITQ